ncbi:MAG: hypothetical protein AAF493_23220 [Pseudomonadota bacterium]
MTDKRATHSTKNGSSGADGCRRPTPGFVAGIVAVVCMTNASAVEFAQEIASVTSESEQVRHGASAPAINVWGDRVVFESVDPDFDDVGDYVSHIFLRDRAEGQTVLLSNGKEGPGNAGSYAPDIDFEGEHVVFESLATNLTCAGCDQNDAMDVFLFDLRTREIIRLSQPSRQDADGPSFDAHVASGGNRVVFTSWATNLVRGDTNRTGDVYLWDRYKGLKRISLTPSGRQFVGLSHSPDISDNGRHVVFVNDTGSGSSRIYRYDVDSGVTEDISDLSPLTESGQNVEPSVSSTGEFIAWATTGYRGRRAQDRSIAFRVVVRQMVSDVQCVFYCVETYPHTALLNDEPGEQRGPQVFGTVGGNKIYHLWFWARPNVGVAYTSRDSGRRHVMLQYDDGAGNDTHLVQLSSNSFGEAVNGNSSQPAIGVDFYSINRWRVAFVTNATNLDPFDDNGSAPDVIVAERIDR